MTSTRYIKGRYIGEDEEIFEQGKVYRGIFDVYDDGFILIVHQSRTYESSPDLWAFKEEWKESNNE